MGFFQGYENIPLKPTVIFVECDDWEGIYIDGKLEHEGHMIRNFIWLDLIKKYGTFNKFTEHYWADEDYMHDRGSLPVKFEDIPKEKLEDVR